MGKSARFRIYLLVALLVAGILTGGREARQQVIKIGCLPPGGVQLPHTWRASCMSDRIGDYDHSALWFGLEPEGTASIRKAQVLLVGSSRMLAAASLGGASEWFRAKGIRYYLLAFGYTEQSGWADLLFKRIRPHPDVVVFDTNQYFTGGLSQPAQAILRDPSGEREAAVATQAFMARAPIYCRFLGFLCGRTAASNRSGIDGRDFPQARERFWFGKNSDGNYPFVPAPKPNTALYPKYLEAARAVVASSGAAPGCVVFTLVPNNEQDDSLGRYLAQNLGANFLAPPPMPGLRSVDHHHLTAKSAGLWTGAFLPLLEPVLKKCVKDSRH